MKTRESGMPDEELWRTFFDPAMIFDRLGLRPECESVVDFGAGYGTFSLAAAGRIVGTVHAFDIDPELVAAVTHAARALGLDRLQVVDRDFVEQGTGLPDRSVDYAMLFNILHAAEAPSLLAEARRILRPDGLLAVIHWNYDPTTPRGPSMAIRLRPEECRNLVAAADFEPGLILDLPPYHYGFTAKPNAE